MTLRQMASAIRNHVVDGLNGVAVTSFSIEQLEDEILLSTSSVIINAAAKGLVDVNKLTQRIDGIKIECRDLSANCDVPSDTCAPHFNIPNINRAIPEPIKYLGTIDGSMKFKVYYDRSHHYHKYRIATSKIPYAWVSTSANGEGMFDVFLFNLGKYNSLKFVTLDAIFDNPYNLLETEYFDQVANSEFYAPAIIQDEVIKILSQRYIQYYRQLHQSPKINTQQ